MNITVNSPRSSYVSDFDFEVRPLAIGNLAVFKRNGMGDPGFGFVSAESAISYVKGVACPSTWR
jgi:hypothetical protein